MPIINSLGSNYSLGFALRAWRELIIFYWTYLADLLGIDHDDWQALETVKERLEGEYGGQAFLVYKGRDAIEFALRAYGFETGDQVLTQAFSCHAIEEGCLRAGLEPVYADIDMATLNPSPETLTQALKRAPQARAVIIQHTLGYPANIKAIAEWCQRHQLVLIEDLAQAVGGRDQEGKPLGYYGQAIIFSFGRDKVVDAVSGGAVLCRDLPKKVPLPHIRKVSPLVVTRDLLYPGLTWKIRHTLEWGIGKIIQKIAQQMKLLTNPIASSTDFIAHLPKPLARLVEWRWQWLPTELGQRLKKAQQYQAAVSDLSHRFPGQIKLLVDQATVERSSNLRYSFWIDDPLALVAWCKDRDVFISDRWYRQPVDYGSLDRHTVYEFGQCEQAEMLAAHVVNLPTHQAVSAADIKIVVEAITSYCQNQSQPVQLAHQSAASKKS